VYLFDASFDEAVELSHIAVDGDLFGYRRLNGNRALTYALDALLRETPVKGTTYGEYLDLFPPPQEVMLQKLSSRSCPHGVARWSHGCDCWKEGAPWRGPLRKALDDLSRKLDERTDRLLLPLLHDPKKAALDFLSGSSRADIRSTQTLLNDHSSIHLTLDQARLIFRLLELQRWRLKMFSFWAWEGEELSEAGPLQALLCAARALDLLTLVDGPPEELEKTFIENLSRCATPADAQLNAAQIYTKLVRPARITFAQSAAHFAIAAHLKLSPIPGEDGDWDTPAITAEVRTIRSSRRDHEAWADGLSVFRVKLSHRRTFEKSDTLAAVLQSQDSEIECWLGAPLSPQSEEERAAALEKYFFQKTPSAFRMATTKLFNCEPLALDALFPHTRRRAVLRIIPQGKTERQKFMRDWYGLLNRFRSNPDLAQEVAERIVQAVESGIAADSLPEVGLYRDTVLQSARAFAQRPDPNSLDHLSLLLDTAGQAGLHLPLWEIQELAWEGARKLELTEEDEEIVAWMTNALGISVAYSPEAPPG